MFGLDFAQISEALPKVKEEAEKFAKAFEELKNNQAEHLRLSQKAHDKLEDMAIEFKARAQEIEDKSYNSLILIHEKLENILTKLEGK